MLLLTLLLALVRAAWTQYATRGECFVRYPDRNVQCAYPFEHREYISEDACLALCLNNLPRCKSVQYHTTTNRCDLFTIEVPANQYNTHSSQPRTYSHHHPGYPTHQHVTADGQTYSHAHGLRRRSRRKRRRRAKRNANRLIRERRVVNDVEPQPKRVGNYYIFQPHQFSQYPDDEQDRRGRTRTNRNSNLDKKFDLPARVIPAPQLAETFDVPIVPPPRTRPRPRRPRPQLQPPPQRPIVQRLPPPELSWPPQHMERLQRRPQLQPPPRQSQYETPPPEQYRNRQTPAPHSHPNGAYVEGPLLRDLDAQPTRYSSEVSDSRNYYTSSNNINNNNNQPDKRQQVGYHGPRDQYVPRTYIPVPLYPHKPSYPPHTYPPTQTYPPTTTITYPPSTTVPYHFIPSGYSRSGYGHRPHSHGGGYPSCPGCPPELQGGAGYPAPHGHGQPPGYGPNRHHDGCYGYGPRLGPEYGSNYYVPTGKCTEYEYAGLYAVWGNGQEPATTTATTTTTYRSYPGAGFHRGRTAYHPAPYSSYGHAPAHGGGYPPHRPHHGGGYPPHHG